MIFNFNTMKRLFLAGAVLLCASCYREIPKMADGYYAAEFKNFDAYGWKEYIAVYVNKNKIVTVEYNAKNASGLIKSWDMDYMRRMNAEDNNYPNRYTRNYAVALLTHQDPAGIDAMTGATDSCRTFKLLAEAVIAQARAGDKRVAFVELPRDEDEQ
ncbi:MAG: FMN-binding protein [Treponema sp.]|jgi:major membrane immunogen (membrane-anchored lipoprotein)|nr:FMN-binding protein [Treponema sp.]